MDVPQNSSPATETPALEIPRDAESNHHWRMTGELPKPKTEASAPSKDSSESPEKPAANGADKSASASEADTTNQEKAPKRSTAESRLNELLADLRNAGLSPKELKTFKKEAQKATQTPADPSPAKPAQVQAVQQPSAQLVEPKEPSMDDFKDKPWEEWEAANRKYNRELAAYESKKAVLEDRQQRLKEANDREFLAKVTEGRARYKDFDEVAMPAAKALMEDGAVHEDVKKAIDQSPVFLDLLYVLSHDPANFEDFMQRARANRMEGMKLVWETEKLVIEELAASKKKASGQDSSDVKEVPRNENGQFVKSNATPEKKVTSAPPPGSEVNSRSAPSGDEVAGAVEKDDFQAYRDAANRRDLQKRKGK